MSEQQQPINQQLQVQTEDEPHITREQIIAVGGTLLTSGLLDLATHGNLPVMLGGIVAAYAAGKLTPEIMKLLLPGSDPDATSAATNAIVNRLAPAPQDDRPQDTLSKLKRLARIKSEEPGQPKDEPSRQPKDDQTEKGEEQPADADAPLVGPITIPVAPKFSEMSHLILPHRLVLCWTVDGPVFGTVEDLLSMVIVGKPGRGKTTALIYYVAMLLKAGAEVHVWDPHGSMSELYGAFPNLFYTDDLEDILADIEVLRPELEARRKLYKRTKQVKHPLLLLADELPVIGEYNKSLKNVEENFTPVKLISDFVLQARKWNCYFIGAGQSTDAEILPTRVTENLSSRIVFYSSVRRATMAGIDLETAKKYLPALKPDDVKGKMIFDCSRFAEPVLGAIPSITIKDVQVFLGSMPIDLIDEDDDEDEEDDDARVPPVTRRQPVQKESQPVAAAQTNADKLDALMQLLQDDKIDLAMFQRLLDKIELSDSDVSRPAQETEQAGLRIVPQTPVDEELERAIVAFQNGATSIVKLAAALEIKPYYAGPLLERVKKELEKRQAVNE